MHKSKAKNAVFWSLFSTIGGIIIQLVYGIIVARLLTPDDFGVMAIAMIVITISKGIVDSGFYQAIIQKKDVSLYELSAVLKFNVILAFIISMSVFFASSLLADLFENTRLDSVFKLLAFVVVFESFTLVQRASLVKEINFNLIAKIELSVQFISSMIGIILALNNFGLYSLVYKTILQVLLTTMFFWIFHPIKVDFKTPIKNIRSLFSFGSFVFIADQIEIMSNQITFGIIGRNYNSTYVGHFTKGFQYQNLLSQTAVVAVNKVVFPSFSKIQDDNEKLRDNYRLLMKISSFFILPIMLIAFIAGNELIYILLGDQWGQTVPYFKILCIAGVFYPFTVFNLNIIKVKGLGWLYFKTCLLSKGTILPAVILGSKFGIIGITIAIVVQQIIAATLNSIFSGNLISYSFLNQVKDVFPFFISAIIAFVLIYPIHSLINNLESCYSLGLTIVAFLSIYLMILFLLSKNDFNIITKIIFWNK